MIGIRSFGTYIPRYRLGKDTVGWSIAGERSIANFDEDSITMAVAAGINCLSGQERNEVDAVLFATTTPPYLEKQNASIVATALDLGRQILTADITNVLRAGTTALKMGMDLIKAGSARQVLVVAADVRPVAPRGDMERNIGDGAAAFLLTSGKAVATIEGSYHIAEHLLDRWRSQGDSFVRMWEERFEIDEGFQRILPEAIGELLSQLNLKPEDLGRAGFYAPDARRYMDMGKKLGLTTEQLQDHMFGKTGNTGTAYPLMLLAGSLEQAKQNEWILIGSYGDGSDAFVFKTGSGIDEMQRVNTLKKNLEHREILKNYETYARWREIWTGEAARRPAPANPSVAALWRETDQNIRLYAGRCKACDYIQYPPQRICANCQEIDNIETVRMSDKLATVFTYSMDYLAGTVDVPLVVAIINFEGGGRMLCMMTDRELSEIEVNMPVAMSFRRLRTVNGIHNYYWKATPLRIPAN